MLPDFPDLKRQLRKTFEYQVKQEASDDPLLSNVKSTVLHEGRAVHLLRDDGSTADILFDKPLQGRTEIETDAIRTGGSETSIKAAHDLAEQLQEGMSKQFFDTLEKTTQEIGNSFDAGGNPLSPEHVLKMYETMELQFSADGTWRPPQMVVGPALTARAEVVFKQLETDPDLRARRDAIVERQRDEWRVREASRKLVD